MWNKIKILASKAWADMVDTYERVKVYLIALTLLVIYIEWGKIKDILLLKSGQKEVDSAKKEDAGLAKTEADDNSKANSLIQDAQNLSNQQPPISEDWYRKDKK